MTPNFLIKDYCLHRYSHLYNYTINANTFEEALFGTASYWKAEGQVFNDDVCPLWSSMRLLKRRDTKKQAPREEKQYTSDSTEYRNISMQEYRSCLSLIIYSLQNVLSTEKHEGSQVTQPLAQESETLRKGPLTASLKRYAGCCQIQHSRAYSLEPCHLSPSPSLMHLPKMLHISASWTEKWYQHCYSRELSRHVWKVGTVPSTQ